MSKKTKNNMNQTTDLNPAELEKELNLSPEQKAFNDLQEFSNAIDHHELKEELWEQLFYTITADDTIMTGNERAAHMMNYKLLITTSKAIRKLFPKYEEPLVKVKVEMLK